MMLRLLSNGDVSLQKITPLQKQALESILAHADFTDVPEAERRIYQKPVNATDAPNTPEATEMAEDWEDIIVPELRELFEGALARVAADLKTIKPEPKRRKKSKSDAADQDSEDEEFEEDPFVADAFWFFRAAMAGMTQEQLLEGVDRKKARYYRLTLPRGHVEDWFKAMNQARLVMAEKELWVEDNGRTHGNVKSHFHYELYTALQGWLVEYVMSE